MNVKAMIAGIILTVVLTFFLLFNRDTKKKRLVVSLTLLVTAIIMPVSALIYHVTGHESHIWLHIHGAFGFMFVIASIFHIVYNWKTLKNYIVSKDKK